MSEDQPVNVKDEIKSYVIIVLVAAIFAFLISHFVIFNATIPSGSMENTIPTGSRVIGLRFAYTFTEPERGDIIIFKYPVDESQYFVKRIIGLPGDYVEIKQGKIYLNHSNVPLEEDYLKEEWVTMNDGLSYQVPEDCYFVLGDNRNVSMDARYWADEALQKGIAVTEKDAEQYTYVSRDSIYAKAKWEYWPKIRAVE